MLNGLGVSGWCGMDPQREGLAKALKGGPTPLEQTKIV
jgi:hypothetical protein